MAARTSPMLLMLALLIAPAFLIALPHTVAAAGCPEGTSLQHTATLSSSLGSDACVNSNGEVTGYISELSGNFMPVPGFDAQGHGKTPQVVTCQTGGWLDVGGQVGCALAAAIIALLAGIIGIFTSLLQAADAAFNAAIQYTIVDFKTWFDAIEGPVSQWWTIFRDLGNIAIIGFFVFIAISIILGLHEYGQKKLIARVIIVSILINFSFLFTVIVINSSNALATAVYNSLPKDSAVEGSKNVRGIGDQFMRYMRISTLRETGSELMTRYNRQNGLADMLWYGFLTGVFSLLATLVLLYGAVLLFGRFVVLIFLLVISAAAFATYLAPAFAESGWGAWWRSLLKNSFLAPVMMLSLGVSLSVAQKLAVPGGVLGQGTDNGLGELVSNPQSANSWSVTMSFVIILGILFVGMYVASRLSTGAARVASVVTGGAVAGAARYGVAPVLRGTLGRAADKRAAKLGLQAEAKRSEIMTDMLNNRRAEPTSAEMKSLMSVMRQKDKAVAKSKRSFDLMNTKPAQTVGKAAGLPSAFTDAQKKSYAATAHHEAEAAAKQALSMAMGKEDAAKIAKESAESERAGGRRGLEEDVKRQEEMLATAKDTAASLKKLAGLPEALEKHESTRLESVRKIQESNDKIVRGEPGYTQEQHKRVMDEQSLRIREAQNEAHKVVQQMEQIDRNQGIPAALKTLQETKNQLDSYNKETDKIAQARTKQVIEQSHALVSDIAAQGTGSAFTQALDRWTGINMRDSNVVHHARHIAEKRAPLKEEADKKRAVDEYNKFVSGGGHDDHKEEKGGGGEHHA